MPVDPQSAPVDPGRAPCSLQWKATLLVVALTVFMTAAVSGYLLRCSEELAREQHRTQVAQAAALLAKGAAIAITNNDRVGLETLAREAANGNPLLRVTITDSEGALLADARHLGAGSAAPSSAEEGLRGVPSPSSIRRSETLVPHPRSSEDGAPNREQERVSSTALLAEQWHTVIPHPRSSEDGAPATNNLVPGAPVQSPAGDASSSLLAITYPITQRRASASAVESGGQSVRLLGYVRTAMATSEWRRSMSSRVDLLVGVGLLATLAAVPLGFLLIRRIVAPMRGLAMVMTQFSEGKLDARSPIERQDEIGSLARSFNQMADEHERTHTRLVRLNSELEERVAYRTRQLRELASRDPLTGLYNRRHFNEVLERRFAEATRYETGLTCVMIDLDEFKSANDQFGHQLGDGLLALAATTIVSQLRTPDLAARFGGDEFIILLPQTNQDRARVLAERVMEKFARDVTERFPGLNVRMSVGIASLGSLDLPDADSLVRAADQALYSAKAAGKNRIALAAAEVPATPS